MKNKYDNNDILIENYRQISKPLILFIILVSLFYFTWWLNINNAGNPYLYGLLVIGEIFHVFQAIGYAFTIYNLKRPAFQKIKYYYPVDIFITVCGEPENVVEKTIIAANNISYPNKTVYVLNDGYVAKKNNWKEINLLAIKHNAIPIMRTVPGGFKAGNVNNALRKTTSPFVVIFDADHIPEKDFLQRTMGYFKDEKLALIQTPQYYDNKNINYLTRASWEQQELFFGPICVGKNSSNSAFWCGTNAVVRRNALESINGVPENNIAEDFLASLFLHQKGWKSIYIPEILAKGMAPHNLKDYITQQFRWARGSLEVIFRYNPLFSSKLTWKQKFQYLSSASYYLNGVIILLDALIPIIVLATGLVPVKAQTSDFIVYFIPFLSSTIYLLIVSTDNQVTFNALQFSSSSFYIYFLATLSTIFGLKVKFNVTSKSQETGNYLKFIVPHLIYILVGAVVIIRSYLHFGITSSFINNASWILFNSIMFTAFIRVAYPWNVLFDRIKNIVFIKRFIPREKLVYQYISDENKNVGINSVALFNNEEDNK